MTKKEIVLQMIENQKIAVKYSEFLNFNYLPENRSASKNSAKQLFSCQAYYFSDPRYYFLKSYASIVAFYDIKENTLYNVLEYVYGKSPTSTQHICKFTRLLTDIFHVENITVRKFKIFMFEDQAKVFYLSDVLTGEIMTYRQAYKQVKKEYSHLSEEDIPLRVRAFYSPVKYNFLPSVPQEAIDAFSAYEYSLKTDEEFDLLYAPIDDPDLNT